jgi:hypothetical protein
MIARFLLVQAPLVGNEAPDFSATAVFDQEFVETKLSDYRVGRIYDWHGRASLHACASGDTEWAHMP